VNTSFISHMVIATICLSPSKPSGIYENRYNHSIPILIDKDARLKNKESFKSNNAVYFRYISKKLKENKNIVLENSINTFGISSFYIMYKDASIASIMDGIASLIRVEWRRLDKQNKNPDYELNYHQDTIDRLYGAPSEDSRTWSEKALPFMKYIDAMPEENKKAILSGQSLKFSQLPEKIKDSLRDTLQSVDDKTKTPDETRVSDFSKMEKALITIQDQSKNKNFMRIFVNMKTNYGGYGFS
jgi:hypothetical protein